MISAVVLAAGASRRMGVQNKLLLPYHSRPLVSHVVHRVCQSRVKEVIVVCGYQKDLVQAALEDSSVTFAHNPDYRRGLASSIAAGIQVVSRDAQGFMICLGDLPGLETADYDRVLDAFKEAVRDNARVVVRPVFAGIPGHPVVFSACYRKELIQEHSGPGCRNLLRRHTEQVREIPWTHDAIIRDVDTPKAYADEVKQ